MTRWLLTVGVAALLLAACGDDTEDLSADSDAADLETDEDLGAENGDDAPDADSNGGEGADADESAEGDAEDTGGTVTLNGESVELSEAYACEDYEGFIGDGETDLLTLGRIVTDAGTYGAKIMAGTYQADDGSLEDHVAIYSWDTFDDAPVSGSWSVSEDDDGYPWIDIDGNTLTVDGAHTDDEGNDWDFDAAVDFEIADGQARCPE